MTTYSCSLDQLGEAFIELLPLKVNIKLQELAVNKLKGTREEFVKELDSLGKLKFLLIEKEMENKMLSYQLKTGEIERVVKEW